MVSSEQFWKTWVNLGKTRYIEPYKGDLESAILDVYFNPGENCQKELEVLKSFAVQLIITGAERNKAGGMDVGWHLFYFNLV